MSEPVSDEDLAAELLWHVKFDDNDQQLPCDNCGNEEPPCIFERMALDLRDARREIVTLKAELQALGGPDA